MLGTQTGNVRAAEQSFALTTDTGGDLLDHLAGAEELIQLLVQIRDDAVVGIGLCYADQCTPSAKRFACFSNAIAMFTATW